MKSRNVPYLDLDYEQIVDTATPFTTKVCPFLDISIDKCPNPAPEVSLIVSVEQLRTIATGPSILSEVVANFGKPVKLAFGKYPPLIPKVKFAYTTLIHDISNASEVRSALIWCQSIRMSYMEYIDDRKLSFMTFDMILLTTSPGNLTLHEMQTHICFDRLIHVDPLVHPVVTAATTDSDATVNMKLTDMTKLHIFGMTEYNRVIYTDYHFISLLCMEPLLFRTTYNLPRTNELIGFDQPSAKPDKVYSSATAYAPLSGSFLSVEPNLQAWIDLQYLAEQGVFDQKHGWMSYGSFTFDTSKRDTSDPQAQQEVLLIPSKMQLKSVKWSAKEPSDWSFPTSERPLRGACSSGRSDFTMARWTCAGSWNC